MCSWERGISDFSLDLAEMSTRLWHGSDHFLRGPLNNPLGPQQEPVYTENICCCRSCFIVLNVGQAGGSDFPPSVFFFGFFLSKSQPACLILTDERVQWLQHLCLPNANTLSRLQKHTQWAQTPQPLGWRSSAQRQPLACLTAGPPPQPSPSQCVDFCTHFIWEPAKESSGPRAAMTHPEAWERPLFPENLPHRRGAGVLRSSICYLVEIFSCWRFWYLGCLRLPALYIFIGFVIFSRFD